MTHYAIFSDIHSNFEALEAALNFLKGLNIDKHIFCGDIVGYGANPNDCVRAVRDLEAICVMGNHDYVVVHNDSKEYKRSNDLAQEAFDWTRKALTSENRQFLNSLPYIYQIGNILISHGSPLNPKEFDYINDKAFYYEPKDVDKHYNFMVMNGLNFIFYGHSHKPIMHLLYENDDVKEEVIIQEPQIVDLTKGITKNRRSTTFSKGIINVGSIGQPRDKDPRASVVVYDDKKNTIGLYRIMYDIQTAIDKIIRAGLPRLLAEKLITA